MRVIKFRGRYVRIENPLYPGIDKWVYGYLIYEDGLPWIRDGKATFQVTVGSEGQYTGLKDKNGKEIYEGDIIRTDGPGDHSEPMTIHVEFELTDTRNGFNITESYIELLDVEIIGNIHENPELLK